MPLCTGMPLDRFEDTRIKGGASLHVGLRTMHSYVDGLMIQ